MTEEKEINIQLRSITVSKFSIEINDDFIAINIGNVNKTVQYTFEVSVENRGAVKDNIMMSKIAISTYGDSEKKVKLGNCEVVTVFDVPDLAKYYDEKNNILHLPVPLEYTITSISITHARAIMHTKCAGTFLQQALLPIVDPMQFLKKPKAEPA